LVFLPSGNPSSGLDFSWTYGINLAAEQGLIFGREVLFSYGPFGYLCADHLALGGDSLSDGRSR